MAFWNKKSTEPMISQAEHVRIVSEKVGEARKDLQQQISGLQIQNETHLALSKAERRRHEAVVADRDKIAAELAALKSARERQLANLAKGSAASAQARKQRANGEGA